MRIVSVNSLVVLGIVMVAFWGCSDGVLAPDGTSSKDNGNASGKAWYEQHAHAVLASDASKRLYQLKVIHQKPRECTMHSERNLLFAMAMFDDNLSMFSAEYRRLIDSDLFEKIALNTVCSIEKEDDRYEHRKPHANETGIRRYPKIKQFLEDNVDFARVLPDKSKQLIGDFIHYDRYINGDSFAAFETLGKNEYSRIENGRNLGDF